MDLQKYYYLSDTFCEVITSYNKKYKECKPISLDLVSWKTDYDKIYEKIMKLYSRYHSYLKLLKVQIKNGLTRMDEEGVKNELDEIVMKLQKYLSGMLDWLKDRKCIDSTNLSSTNLSSLLVSLKITLRPDVPSDILNWFFESDENETDKTIVEIITTPSGANGLDWKVGDKVKGLKVKIKRIGGITLTAVSGEETSGVLLDKSIFYGLSRKKDEEDRISAFASIKNFISDAASGFVKKGVSIIGSGLQLASDLVSRGVNFAKTHPKILGCVVIAIVLFFGPSTLFVGTNVLKDLILSSSSAVQNYFIIAMQQTFSLAKMYCSLPFLGKIILGISVGKLIESIGTGVTKTLAGVVWKSFTAGMGMIGCKLIERNVQELVETPERQLALPVGKQETQLALPMGKQGSQLALPAGTYQTQPALPQAVPIETPSREMLDQLKNDKLGEELEQAWKSGNNTETERIIDSKSRFFGGVMTNVSQVVIGITTLLMSKHLSSVF